MSVIEKINERLTIDEVLKFLPTLEEQGHNYVGKCPTGHDSKSGTSFQVNTLEPNFHCFNCGVHGNYIHLIELVKYGTSSAGKTGSPTFKDTIKLLCEEYGIEGEGTNSERGQVGDIIDVVIEHYHSQLKSSSSMLKACADKYGLTEDFIISERWGYGRECPGKKLLNFFSADELLSTGLFNKTKTGSVFHIYQNRIVMPYNDRGRVYYSIGRKTKQTKGINGADASKYYKQYIHSAKRPYVSKCIQNEIIKFYKDTGSVLITEGITDFLSAKMHGFNSVSAVTTSFKKAEFESVVNFCKRFQKVFIVTDNDENGAGQKGNRRIAEMLLDAGVHAYSVLLPRPDTAAKIDLNEYLREHSRGDLESLLNAAPPYLDHCLEQIKDDTHLDQVMDELEPVIEGLKAWGGANAEIYLSNKVKPRFNLDQFPEVFKSIKESVFKVENKANEYVSYEDIFNENDTNISLISSGQDYYNEALYYTITRPEATTDKNGIVRIVNSLFMVNSNREILTVKDYQIINASLAIRRKLSPEYNSENWTFKGTKYSVQAFVNGDAQVKPDEVFERIDSFQRRFIYQAYDNDHAVVAVAIMASYLLMCFQAIPYFHLLAERASGKTTLLEIINMLGFNSVMASSISDAALFRMVESHKPLLLIDEAENLNPSPKQREAGSSEKLELLKSGYKKSGAATRCEGQSNVVVTFYNYCMKFFAGTRTIDSVLGDRTIPIEMRRAMSDIQLEELIESKIKDEAQEIRDMLHCFAMQYVKEVTHIYTNDLDMHKEMLKEYKVMFRQRELWAPLLTMGLLVDKYSPNTRIFNTLLEKAKNSTETKETFGGDSKGMEIVEKLYLWMKRVQGNEIHSMILLYSGDIYLRKGLTEHFIKDELRSDENEDDFHYVNYNVLKNVLRKYHAIDKDSEMKRFNTGATRGNALHLDPKRMLESLMIYKNDYDEDVLVDIQAYEAEHGKRPDKKDVTFEDMGMD